MVHVNGLVHGRERAFTQLVDDVVRIEAMDRVVQLADFLLESLDAFLSRPAYGSPLSLWSVLASKYICIELFVASAALGATSESPAVHGDAAASDAIVQPSLPWA